MTPIDPHDPRVYLAAERTFLAWLRTGLALMGFGFIAARFALIIGRGSEGPPGEPAPADLTLPLGVGLVIIGVIVNIYAAWRHSRRLRTIDSGEFRKGFGVTFACLLAGVLALFGLVLAFSLVLF